MAQVTVTLAPEGAGTRVTHMVTFPDVSGKVAAIGYGAEAKGLETYAKLAALVEG